MTQEAEREKFESVLGAPPDGCKWSGSGYYQTSYHNWKAQDYSEKWKGWRARAALEAKQAEVQMPEPVAFIDATRQECRMAGCWRVAGDWDGLYTEQQVRAVLDSKK